MTEFHFFTKPTAEVPGTLNPVYEILDHPIVMGHPDDVVITGEVPEAPLIDGREVSDPRLVAALSQPVELDRVEALDRSAKLAGILRALGVDDGARRLRIAADVPAVPRALAILAAMRLGVVVDDRDGDGEDPGTARLHAIDAPGIEPGRAAVKVVRSRFEGVGVSLGGETANLDQAMRDSRVEPAEVVPLEPTQILVLTAEGPLTATSSLAWLEECLRPER